MNVNDRFADAKTWKQMRNSREQWNFSFLFFFCFVGAAGRVLVMTTWLCSILLLVQLLVLAVKRAASHFGGPGCGQKKKKKKEKKRRIDHLWNVAHTIAWLFKIFKHKTKSAHLKLKKKNEREREKQQPTNKKWNYIRNQWMEEKKKRRNDNDTSSYWNVRCLACGHVTWATEKYQENSSSFWIHLAARSSFFGPTSQPPSLWIHMHQKPNEWHER